MVSSTEFWIGVICGAVGLAVLTAITGWVHGWRARRAERRGDREDRDTGGTSGWDLRG